MRPTYSKIEQSYIDYLKSIGCKFYAPLKEDLKDYITETNGVIIGTDGSYTDNGYLFTGNTEINWNIDFIKSIVYSSKITVIIDYKKTSQSGHAMALTTRLGSGYNNDRGIIFSCDNSSPNILSTGFSRYYTLYGTSYPNSGQINTQHTKTGFIYDGNGLMTRIQDGVIYNNYTKTISQSNFPNMSDNNNITVGGIKNATSDRWRGTIGNVLIFDKILSQNEIDNLE